MIEKPDPESAIQSSKDASKVIIEIAAMHKWFGAFHVLKNINLRVSTGERIVICGPSGSGKSTLIRCINRLEEHQQGKIVVDGVELTGDLKNIEIIRSEVGIVFQQFNLFPHLTVMENCSLALIWVRNMPKADAEEIALKYLERVQIPEQARKYPGQLSGGQQQRVALEHGGIQILVDDDEDGIYESTKDFSTEVKTAHGMHFLGPGDLLVNSEGPEGSGLYRLKDLDGDDEADELKLIAASNGNIGEHGPHGIRTGIDGSLYVLYGNHAFPDVAIEPLSPSQ